MINPAWLNREGPRSAPSPAGGVGIPSLGMDPMMEAASMGSEVGTHEQFADLSREDLEELLVMAIDRIQELEDELSFDEPMHEQVPEPAF